MSDGAPPPLRAFVFLGALLLFALEPLCGRLLVARFGGAFYVWTSALMFFQATLVAGYLYAHRVAPRLGRWHVALLLLAALALLPPAVGAAPPRAGAWEVVLALGLPMAVLAALLSATSVTAQRAALARDPRRANVFALYALSNAGSLVALALDARGDRAHPRSARADAPLERALRRLRRAPAGARAESLPRTRRSPPSRAHRRARSRGGPPSRPSPRWRSRG